LEVEGFGVLQPVFAQLVVHREIFRMEIQIDRHTPCETKAVLKMKHWIAVGVACVGLALQVNAHLIDPDGNLYVGSNDNAAIMSGLLGTDVVLLFKQEYNDGVAGESEGAAQYFKVTNPVNGNNNLATISWDLTGSGYELYGVAWKDGTLVNFSGQKGSTGRRSAKTNAWLADLRRFRHSPHFAAQFRMLPSTASECRMAAPLCCCLEPA
jgi:hypothetical protein